MTTTQDTPEAPSAPRAHAASQEFVLATPAELRDRIRQLGKSAKQQDEPQFVAVREIVARLASQEGALLPILHEVQHALGHIPKEVVGVIAEGLNLSRAEVHGVITYYHHFRSVPAGRHVLEICRAESCQAMGGEAMWEHACHGLGLPAEGGTSQDNAVTLQAVYCLGLCAMSPNVALDGKPHARITPRRLESLLVQAGAA